jgi:hypothetical protein
MNGSSLRTTYEAFERILPPAPVIPDDGEWMPYVRGGPRRLISSIVRCRENDGQANHGMAQLE